MRSHRTIWIRTAICLAALTGGAASAQFQPLPSTRPAAPAPLPATDPALAAAEQAFSLLDEASRRAVLEALMWSGDYNGVVGINFGKRGYDGIRAFQKKKNLPQTGILDDMQRQMLLAEGRRLRDSVRFSVITDASSGMKIGIPLRVTEKKEPFEANGLKGTRYRSNDGALALDVAAWPVAMQTLDQFLAQGLAAKPNRKVTYRLQRPDFIVMSGEENGRTFYTRAALHGGAVRGFTFSYPAARKGDFERVMLAIANSFDPFPGTAVAQPASPLPGATAPARPAGPVPLAAAARPRIAGVGVVTAPGRVLTSAAILKASCTLTVRGMAVQVPGGDQRGLSVLQVAGLTAPAVTLAHSQSPPQPDEPLVAFGADGSGVILVSGAGLGGIGALRFTGGLGEGAAGAPVFNAAGALVGIVQEAPKAIAVASLGAAVARSHVMIAPLALGLDRAASDAPVSAGTLAARIAPSIVPIICAN